MAFWNSSLVPNRRNERSLSPFVDFDDVFDRLRREFFSPDTFRSGDEGFIPRVEVKETDKKILVCAELPGINEKDINVSLRENNLIIEGEKKSEKRKEEKGYFSSEFSYGTFYRSIPLHSEVDPENVEATYKNGILDVSLSKLEEAKQQTKRISIRH